MYAVLSTSKITSALSNIIILVLIIILVIISSDICPSPAKIPPFQADI